MEELKAKVKIMEVQIKMVKERNLQSVLIARKSSILKKISSLCLMFNVVANNLDMLKKLAKANKD